MSGTLTTSEALPTAFEAHKDAGLARKKPTAIDTLMRIFRGDPSGLTLAQDEIVKLYGRRYLEGLVEEAQHEVVEGGVTCKKPAELEAAADVKHRDTLPALESLAAMLESMCGGAVSGGDKAKAKEEE